MMIKAYLVYGLIVIGMMATAQYRGWGWSPASLNHATPRTIRDNPGSYRPVYGGFGHIFGGK